MKMELWIRSQNRECLLKTDIVMLEEIEENKEYWIYAGHEKYEPYAVFGIYYTKERALEILDEIQNILMPKVSYEPVFWEDTKPGDDCKHYTCGSYIKHSDVLNTYVYEMPEN